MYFGSKPEWMLWHRKNVIRTGRNIASNYGSIT